MFVSTKDAHGIKILKKFMNNFCNQGTILSIKILHNSILPISFANFTLSLKKT
jgi:hypothetical protein